MNAYLYLCFRCTHAIHIHDPLRLIQGIVKTVSIRIFIQKYSYSIMSTLRNRCVFSWLTRGMIRLSWLLVGCEEINLLVRVVCFFITKSTSALYEYKRLVKFAVILVMVSSLLYPYNHILFMKLCIS